jgi:hypothetical protein
VILKGQRAAESYVIDVPIVAAGSNGEQGVLKGLERRVSPGGLTPAVIRVSGPFQGLDGGNTYSR